VAAGKASKEGHPHESGEDVGAEDGVVANARMLKRKRLTPPGSPASKRPPRGASPNSVTANGEPAESVPKRTGSNLADLNVVKQDVGKPGAVVGTTESVEPGADRVNDEETKVIAKTQGEIQVTSAATAEDHPGPKADGDTLQAGDQSQSVATGVQVSSSLATSSVTTVADEVKHHTIPSHAGMMEILTKALSIV
jgi:SWI/SNF related-matrix-associated actin-dependent regulator of chromatin subfamily C